jgi:hypothetical protein
MLACKGGLLGAEEKDCSAAGLEREVVSGMLVPELRCTDLVQPTRKSLRFGDSHAGRVAQAMGQDEYSHPIDIGLLGP